MVVDDQQAQNLIDWERAKPGKLAQDLLRTGMAVLIVAPFLSDGVDREGHDEAEPLYYTYNQAKMGCRVQDILTGLAYLDQHLRIGKRHLIGRGRAGIWALFARAVIGAVERTAVDWGRLGLDRDESWQGELFTPGIRALGDVRGALVLCVPGRLLVYGSGRRFPERIARRSYRAAGQGARLEIEAKGMSQGRIAEWISAP